LSDVDAKKKTVHHTDLLIAPVSEGILILIAAFVGWAAQQPFVFASLGPTAYELVETPERPSARPYNIIAGHLIAVLAGFAALWLTHASGAPPISLGTVPLRRISAAVVAVVLTVFVTLLARATQPASLSTTLLIALGIMQSWKAGMIIMASVLLMTVIGEPLRRWRARQRKHASQGA